jgi:transcriptional regulator with XRE-family HTH domain
MSGARYELARKRAGLSQAQAKRVLCFSVTGIEDGSEAPTPERHALMARAYGVTECWLAGHDPSPDLTELWRQAQDKGVSDHDWQEIATFAASIAMCGQCKEAKV